MFTSHEQNAGKCRNRETTNKPPDNLAKFKVLGSSLKIKIARTEIMRIKISLGNAC